MLNEFSKGQNKDSNYIKQTVARSTPANNNAVINTLTSAQRSIKHMKDYSKYFGYDSIENIITLENDINKGNARKPKNRMYAGNGMSGILNIGAEGGKEKQVQEDSILMLSHPENKNFRIALVADGMGGMGNGDAASHIATAITMDWFKKLPAKFYNYDIIRHKYKDGKTLDITFEEAIKHHLINVNDEIVKCLGNSSGTTFSAAIIRNKNGRDTVKSISIGDSKILKVSPDGQVSQLSKDDNMLSEGMKSGSLYVEDSDPNTVYTSDPRYKSVYATYKPRQSMQGVHTLNEGDMRFHRKNNIITGYLGGGQTRTTIKRKIR